MVLLDCAANWKDSFGKGHLAKPHFPMRPRRWLVPVVSMVSAANRKDSFGEGVFL
ncbi:MAG: hypothetical protein ABGX16_22245 [Pirellulales bacterium]